MCRRDRGAGHAQGRHARGVPGTVRQVRRDGLGSGRDRRAAVSQRPGPPGTPGGAVGAPGGRRPRGGERGLQAVAGGAVERGRKAWLRGTGGKRGHGSLQAGWRCPIMALIGHQDGTRTAFLAADTVTFELVGGFSELLP